MVTEPGIWCPAESVTVRFTVVSEVEQVKLWAGLATLLLQLPGPLQA